ncbi:hypothetical protein [Candidatus Synechococcus spongiarum]|uniref:hypothetical protein n=1 Tax=Candidatus Synechococcus spongiarum TaxID=431041 RepID=UPI0004AD4EB2|nr:hypothetical protein [Candidatus Synechococcus spongiarum]
MGQPATGSGLTHTWPTASPPTTTASLGPGWGWLAPTSSAYRLLWALAPYSGQAQPQSWEISLEGERQEALPSPAPVDYSLKLCFSLLF